MDVSMSAGPRPPLTRGSTPSLVRTFVPHLVWEGLLLLAVLVFAVVVNTTHPGAFSQGRLWPSLATLGLVSTGLALSFRTATPNLAVAMIAASSGWWYAQLVLNGSSQLVAGLVAVVAALGVGLLLGLLAGLTSMPGWVVSFAGAVVLQGALLSGNRSGGVALRVGLMKSSAFLVWVVLFVLGSVAGAVALAVPAVRAALSANRPDPGETLGRWRAGKLLGALVGMGGSAVLAGLAGVLNVSYIGFAQTTDSGFLQYALAAVLLAGVSPFGRRAGVFGLVLAVVLVALVQFQERLEGATSATVLVTVGVFALVGVVVNWLLEWLGRLADRAPAVEPVVSWPT